MKTEIVEVRPDVDLEQAKEGVRQAYAAVKHAEQREATAAEEEAQATITLENKAEDRRRTAKECRLANLECGRWLVHVRKAFPRKGPNAKGWGDFLREEGIAERTARDWMALAGHVEKVSAPEDDGADTFSVPTRDEVRGISRRLPAPPAPLAVVPTHEEPTAEQREASYRREVEKGLPPKAEVRDAKTEAYFQSVAVIRDQEVRIEMQGAHLRHVTGSADEFQKAKQGAIDRVNFWLKQLEDAGVLDGNERRRQLTLLDGGKR